MRFRTRRNPDGTYRARIIAAGNAAVLGADDIDIAVEEDGDSPQEAVHKAAKKLRKNSKNLHPDERRKAAVVQFAADKRVHNAALDTGEAVLKSTPQGMAALWIANKLKKDPDFRKATRHLWG